ncbi:MAG: hypothetical protein QNJ60_00020 [Xenococcaceae cyanobacterium MO_188.B19]|nr:hypothetical protein [Xenococcaceae cyanobacterium MO_188.B19]
MSRFNGNGNRKISEVLDACLSSESPEIKAKVHEIINVSGLDADDPMFLILALTGQMRVFLEAAPSELSKLLADWKESNAKSLEEIYNAISLVQETQQQQAETIAQKIEKVSNKCVSDIKKAGSAATSAIADANSETLAQAQDTRDEVRRLKNEIQGLYAQIEKDRQTNHEILKVLLTRTGTTMNGLDKAVAQIDRSHGRIQKLTVNSIWVRLTDWFSPIVVLFFWGGICLAIGMRFSEYLYPRSVKLSGRELMEWNLARLIKCQKDKNPKCTFWIVPPEQR